MKNLILLLLLLVTFSGVGQRVYKVGVKESKPFVIKYEDGRWGGLCLDIVEYLSKEQDFEYELVELKESYNDAINLVETDSLDFLALDMTITGDRLNKVDFTQPYFSTPTSIATKKKEISIMKKIFSMEFLKNLMICLGVILVIAIIIWLAEIKYDSKIRNSPLGIFDALYFTIVTLSTVGYGDVTPQSKIGKFLTTLVIVASLFMVATLTGMISSSLTVNELEGGVTSLSELNKMKTGTIAGTFSEKLLKSNDIKAINFDRPTDAYDAIKDGELDAFVYDKAMLDYLSTKDKYSDIIVSDNSFSNQTYGFVFKKGNPMVDEVNPLILNLINGDRWSIMISQYSLK